MTLWADFSLRVLCDLGVSAVIRRLIHFTAETLRPPRWHREF
jgi:hypothetical protein